MAAGTNLITSSEGVVRLNATADQVWAFDADYLYRRLDLLKPVGRHLVHKIRMLDLVSDLLLVAGVIAPFFLAWWTIVPLIGFACLQRSANRRMAGEVAARAAQESTDIFLYLYNSGVLSVERPGLRPGASSAGRTLH